MLFDQHADEVTPDVVALADMVTFFTSIQHHKHQPHLHIRHQQHYHHQFEIFINTKVAEFYLGPGGSQNYDFEHIQV